MRSSGQMGEDPQQLHYQWLSTSASMDGIMLLHCCSENTRPDVTIVDPTQLLPG